MCKAIWTKVQICKGREGWLPKSEATNGFRIPFSVTAPVIWKYLLRIFFFLLSGVANEIFLPAPSPTYFPALLFPLLKAQRRCLAQPMSGLGTQSCDLELSFESTSRVTAEFLNVCGDSECGSTVSRVNFLLCSSSSWRSLWLKVRLWSPYACWEGWHAPEIQTHLSLAGDTFYFFSPSDLLTISVTCNTV